MRLNSLSLAMDSNRGQSYLVQFVALVFSGREKMRFSLRQPDNLVLLRQYTVAGFSVAELMDVSFVWMPQTPTNCPSITICMVYGLFYTTHYYAKTHTMPSIVFQNCHSPDVL